MKFAFIFMGQYDAAEDRAEIKNGQTQVAGVPDIETACTVAKEFLQDGVGCIELCGAFGEEGARRIIEATGNTIPIGYVTHLPEQDELYKAVFGE